MNHLDRGLSTLSPFGDFLNGFNTSSYSGKIQRRNSGELGMVRPPVKPPVFGLVRVRRLLAL